MWKYEMFVTFIFFHLHRLFTGIPVEADPCRMALNGLITIKNYKKITDLVATCIMKLLSNLLKQSIKCGDIERACGNMGGYAQLPAV